MLNNTNSDNTANNDKYTKLTNVLCSSRTKLTAT